MIYRLFLFLIGFGLSVAGGVSIIAYLNLMVAGKSFADYLIFISQQIECYFLILGVILIWMSIYYPFQKG